MVRGRNRPAPGFFFALVALYVQGYFAQISVGFDPASEEGDTVLKSSPAIATPPFTYVPPTAAPTEQSGTGDRFQTHQPEDSVLVLPPSHTKSEQVEVAKMDEEVEAAMQEIKMEKKRLTDMHIGLLVLVVSLLLAAAAFVAWKRRRKIADRIRKDNDVNLELVELSESRWPEFAMLVTLGFHRSEVATALMRSDNNLNRAKEWLWANAENGREILGREMEPLRPEEIEKYPDAPRPFHLQNTRNASPTFSPQLHGLYEEDDEYEDDVPQLREIESFNASHGCKTESAFDPHDREDQVLAFSRV